MEYTVKPTDWKWINQKLQRNDCHNVTHAHPMNANRQDKFHVKTRRGRYIFECTSQISLLFPCLPAQF